MAKPYLVLALRGLRDIPLVGGLNAIEDDAVRRLRTRLTYSACDQQSGMAAPVGSPHLKAPGDRFRPKAVR
jgi:hypothetical protein